MRWMVTMHVLVHIRVLALESWGAILVVHSILVVLTTIVVHLRWWRHLTIHSHTVRLAAIHSALIHVLTILVALRSILELL